MRVPAEGWSASPLGRCESEQCGEKARATPATPSLSPVLRLTLEGVREQPGALVKGLSRERDIGEVVEQAVGGRSQPLEVGRLELLTVQEQAPTLGLQL